MAIELSTTAKEIGRIRLREPSSSADGYYFTVYAYYTAGTGGNATINAKVKLNTSSAHCDGTISVSVGNWSATAKSWDNQYSITSNAVAVTYPDSGNFGNKTITVTLSNLADGHWNDGSGFDITVVGNNYVSATITLPSIDAVPVINSLTYAIQSKGYTSNTVTSAVAGKSKYRITINGIQYARELSYMWKWPGSDVENSGTISINYPTTATNKTFDIECPAYASDYRITISVTAKNKRTSTTSELTGDNRPFVYGYTKPIYANSTTATRCDSSGNASAHGTYGKLHLTWTIQNIPNNQLKTPTVTVTINGITRTLTSTGGSINDGYFDYLFNNLPTNYEAKFNVVLTDEIDTNTITTLGIVKAIVPLSLYQNNNLIGIAVGAMATSKGFYIYNSTDIPVYVKRRDDAVVREVYIDTNDVLHIGSKKVAYTSGSSL